MAPSAQDVKDVLGGTDLTDSKIDEFASDAEAIYDAARDTSVNATVKNIVEAHLAAHLIRSPRSDERELDSASEAGGNVDFAGDTGMMFEATRPGQQAVAIDPTGALANLTDDSGTDFTLP